MTISKEIFVGDLPQPVDSLLVRGAMEQFGPVDSVRTVLGPGGSAFGFCKFVDFASAQAAVEAGSVEIAGTRCRVAYGHPRRKATVFVFGVAAGVTEAELFDLCAEQMGSAPSFVNLLERKGVRLCRLRSDR